MAIETHSVRTHLPPSTSSGRSPASVYGIGGPGGPGNLSTPAAPARSRRTRRCRRPNTRLTPPLLLFYDLHSVRRRARLPGGGPGSLRRSPIVTGAVTVNGVESFYFLCRAPWRLLRVLRDGRGRSTGPIKVSPCRPGDPSVRVGLVGRGQRPHLRILISEKGPGQRPAPAPYTLSVLRRRP